MEKLTIKEYVRLRTKAELRKELKGLNDAIDIVECFSTRDLALREEIEAELERRVQSCGH